jgi:hypothetical protein
MTGMENIDLLHDTCQTAHMIPDTMTITDAKMKTGTAIITGPVITDTMIITIPTTTGMTTGIEERAAARITGISGKEGKDN